MTEQQHPITPPPELVEQWNKAALSPPGPFGYNEYLAIQAARWGADQQLKLDAEQINKVWQAGADVELEACVKWIEDCGYHPCVAEDLRAARRPKPPNLKEQALAALAEADGADYPVVCTTLTADQHALIRRALEQLDD